MIAEFSLLLSFGMSLMWCLMPRAQVTSGFFRIQMMIVMALTALAMLSMGRLSGPSGEPIPAGLLLAARISSGISLACAYAGSALWTLERRRAGAVTMPLILLATLASLILSRGGTAAFGSPREAFHLLSSFTTATVLGAAVTGMLLGHWYLTAPTMSIEPLKSLSWFLAGAVLLRLGISLIGWLIAGQMLHGGVQWTWFTLRWLAGIIGPFVISVMALKILKYRNTQAATGVLFAGVILTFIGEMSAALLYSELHTPF